MSARKAGGRFLRLSLYLICSQVLHLIEHQLFLGGRRVSEKRSRTNSENSTTSDGSAAFGPTASVKARTFQMSNQQLPLVSTICSSVGLFNVTSKVVRLFSSVVRRTLGRAQKTKGTSALSLFWPSTNEAFPQPHKLRKRERKKEREIRAM